MKVLDTSGLTDVFEKIKEAIGTGGGGAGGETGGETGGFNGSIIPLTQAEYNSRKAAGTLVSGTMYPIIDEEIW